MLENGDTIVAQAHGSEEERSELYKIFSLESFNFIAATAGPGGAGDILQFYYESQSYSDYGPATIGVSLGTTMKQISTTLTIILVIYISSLQGTRDSL